MLPRGRYRQVMEQYDVVVVGAGLAGLEAARGLAERGASVLVVDRRDVVDERVATTGIFVRRTLEDFDLPEDCLGLPVRDVVVASPAGRELHLTSDQVEYRVGRMGRLYRRWLDGAVAGGAVWAPGTTFVSAVPAPGGGLAVDLQTADSPRRVEARFLIGADGSQSAVARALGMDVNRREIVGAETVYEGVPLDGPPHFRCVLDPHVAPGYLAWVVHDGEEVHIGVGGQVRRYAVAQALRVFTQRMQARYDGRWFRRRFRKRLALRNALVALWTPAALELGCALLRTPPGRAVARDVFFGRGSFPNAPH